MDYGLAPPQYDPTNLKVGTKVRISEDLRNCAVFLGKGTAPPDDFTPFATAFFAIYQWHDVYETWLITARHVARKLGNHRFKIRFNNWDGGSFVWAVEHTPWIVSGDPAVDVAAVRLEPPNEADVTPIKLPRHAVRDRNPKGRREARFSDVGAGDMVYVVGLFERVGGVKRNLILVHGGTIALFPSRDGELVPIRVENDKGAMTDMMADVYIVESQAVSGASGSPVFVRIGDVEAMPKDESVAGLSRSGPTPRAYGEVSLLGMWRGSWKDSLKKRTDKLVTSGFGIVTPAQKILDLLTSEPLEMKRKQEAKATIGKNSPSEDSVQLPSEAVPERFERTLKTMLSTPPQPKSAKRARAKKW